MGQCIPTCMYSISSEDSICHEQKASYKGTQHANMLRE